MDYVDDGCMHMFTPGQVTVMRNILSTTRASILTSTGCSGTVGVSERSVESSVDLYPNPANDAVYIEYHLSFPALSNVAVYDMLGKKVAATELHSSTGKQQLNIAD